MHWEQELLLARQAYWCKWIGKENDTSALVGVSPESGQIYS
jgi:hypothetical protein